MDEHLTEQRKLHIEGVIETAKKLAAQYGADPEKAETAARFHDLCRGISVEQRQALVAELNLDAKYADNAALGHSKMAAGIIVRDHQITDEDIINAVSYHTTGRAGMSTLEKVVYLADKIEPNRTYTGVEALREVAERSLDEACLMALESAVNYVGATGFPLDPNTERAIEDIKRTLG